MKRDMRDTRRLPAEVLERVGDAAGLELRDARGRTMLVEGRARGGLEKRSVTEGGMLPIRGYATVYDTAYPVMGGKASGVGWDETITRGAAAKSIGERDDVRLLLNHDGGAFARTRSGTLALSSDSTGLLVEAELDMRDPEVQSLAVKMERGDMDEMSFAFQVLQQSWDQEFTQRSITELRLFDVSVVTYPANEATSVEIAPGDPADGDESGEDDPILDPPMRSVEVTELERRGFALVDARALIDLAR